MRQHTRVRGVLVKQRALPANGETFRTANLDVEPCVVVHETPKPLELRPVYRLIYLKPAHAVDHDGCAYVVRHGAKKLPQPRQVHSFKINDDVPAQRSRTLTI